MAFRVFLTLCIVRNAYSYPGRVSCGTSLVVGSRFMNKAAVSSTERAAYFTRDGQAVACGGTQDCLSTLLFKSQLSAPSLTYSQR